MVNSMYRVHQGFISESQTPAQNGCDSSKQKAAEIADEWEQRAERANEVGHVTEFLRGNTVQLDESDCSEQEQLWRQLTEHAKQQRKQGLGPSQEARQGKIGDYANLEKLNGNFDLLDAMDMQVNGYTWDTIDKHDWTTWPAWMVREMDTQTTAA